MSAEPTKRETPLSRRFPELGSSVPFRAIAEVPTPVERATAIDDYLGRGDVWIKRDDRVSSLYGGNKIRRFEYLFADAMRREKTELFTAGGLASTQVIATVLHGRRAGFEVTAVLFDQPMTRFAREALLLASQGGGHLVRGGGYTSTAIKGISAYCKLTDPYLILPGASSPMAVLGYVDAMLELGDQVARGELPRPDLVVLATGSGGTLAGLSLGAAILGWDTLPIGVRITEAFACNRATIRTLIELTACFLARRAPSFSRFRIPRPRFALHHGAIGRGYGEPTDDAIEAIPYVERLIGTPGEVTYSGKALAGLRAIAREHPTKKILFWNTLSSVKPEVDWTNIPRGFEDLFEGELPV